MRKFMSCFLIMLLFIANIQKTLAYVNNTTKFDIIVAEWGFMDKIAFGNKTYKDVFDDFINTQTNNYFAITSDIRKGQLNNRPSNIDIYVSKNYPITDILSYYQQNTTYYTYKYLSFISSNTFKHLYITYGNLESKYDEVISCIEDYDSCSWSESTNFNTSGRTETTSSVSNDSDFTINIPSTTLTNYDTIKFPVYTNFNLTLGTPSQSLTDDTRFYFKDIYINDRHITTGMSIPTYYDLYYSSQPDEPVEPDEPDEPVEPDDDSIFTHIYWFFDNSDNYGVLANIYILLFLYCITNLLIKFYGIIRYKNRR